MIDTLLSVLASALSIWDHAESRNYLDQLTSLKEAYYAELAKPDDSRSDAILDDCLSKLRIIGTAYASAVSGTNTGNTTG